MLFRGGIYRSNLYRGLVSATVVVYPVPYGDIVLVTPQGSLIQSQLPKGNIINLTPQGSIK